MKLRELTKKFNVILKYALVLLIFWLTLNHFFAHQSVLQFNRQEIVRNNQEKQLSDTNENQVIGSQKEQKPKLILLWTGFYNKYWAWAKIFDRQLKNECSNHCLFTSNKDKILEADAIVFHAGDLKSRQPEFLQPKRIYPTKRKKSQIYVLLTFEAAPYLQYIHPEFYNNFYNWTMNYRNDADVFMPYGKLIPKKKEEEINKYKVTEEDLENRKNAAIWLVSHCHTSSKREKLVNIMQRYMEVDIYGRCGHFSCGNVTVLMMTKSAVWKDPCQETILSYKFYLAFENAVCTDYVTEKLYRALDIGIIPVVYGGANYTAVAPPHSFIDVRDFNSTIELVKYLDKVGSNATLYNSYLKWKQDYNIDLGHPFRPHSCGLCDKLHDQTSINKHQSHANLKNLIRFKESCQGS